MEPAVAGVLYAAETIIEGAAALATGMAHPTLPLKTKLLHISSVPLPRSYHTISVVKGRAYIFGGEIETGKLADNAMHIVILPSSGVLEADYTSNPARSAQPGGETPAPRKGHTAVVIGDSIYIFGGEGVTPENGRIWVYSTISNNWTYLDPSPDAPYPTHRTGHAAASSEFPGPKQVIFKEKAPQQPADPSRVVPEPADSATWGTIMVVGGRDTTTNELLTDGLAFDVRTRAWSNIPTPPGPPREGASLALMGNHLYRFGGKGIETYASGGMQYLVVNSIWEHAKGGTTPLVSGWAWEDVPHTDGSTAPQARSNAGLTGVTTGQGRHYLLVLGGEGEAAGPTSAFFDDIWAFQLPSEHGTAAVVKDTMRASFRRNTRVGDWAEALYTHVDDAGVEKEIPGLPKKGVGKRGRFAVAGGSEVDGASVIAWGGVDERGAVLGDGWLVTVER
ncbi:galactose oxidase [Melanomma pulvis-pyrius CBS 109.77]|uniref:Galactose oxidase n=1 Tax=Melanomma pulvis-pyrius CBS 109.77 TaxID=1314802 RepID=A0A6A6X4N8_9PLEO|nr:galactose oxidase [Melanomma pulvis-pyrius CBS 109.77]